MTNLVQFPGLGLSFELNRVAFSIGGFSIYWYGVCIALGICLALVFAFRHSIEFGVDPDSMVDVILIGIVLGIVSARAYYVAMAPFKYESIWEMIAIRDGGLAIYGGIIGGCAPAFAEVFMEAMADAAVMYGIPRATAYPLVSKMLEGTAALQLASGKHPAAMKDDVCSPGGATICGIASLEEHGFRGAVIDAVKAIQGD